LKSNNLYITSKVSSNIFRYEVGDHSIKILYNNFFSMHKIVKLFNLSWDIMDLRLLLNSFNFENVLPADATVIGTINKIR